MRLLHTPAPSPAPAPRVLRILIVEDHPDAGESLGELLELEGHRVLHAKDGRTALALLRAERPDALVCDLGLPDLSGHEVLLAARAGGFAPPIAVSISGYVAAEDEARALAAGFAAHFPKPAHDPLIAHLALEARRQ